MAKMLVETLSSEWDPAKYEDRYQTAVRELIEAKVQNRPKTAKPLTPPSRRAGLDIVAILEESIRESAEKRKKMPGRPCRHRMVISPARVSSVSDFVDFCQQCSNLLACSLTFPPTKPVMKSRICARREWMQLPIEFCRFL